jgi:hypothetical protein
VALLDGASTGRGGVKSNGVMTVEEAPLVDLLKYLSNICGETTSSGRTVVSGAELLTCVTTAAGSVTAVTGAFVVAKGFTGFGGSGAGAGAGGEGGGTNATGAGVGKAKKRSGAGPTAGKYASGVKTPPLTGSASKAIAIRQMCRWWLALNRFCSSMFVLNKMTQNAGRPIDVYAAKTHRPDNRPSSLGNIGEKGPELNLPKKISFIMRFALKSDGRMTMEGK